MSVLAEIERSAIARPLTHLTGSQGVTTTESEAICDTRRLHWRPSAGSAGGLFLCAAEQIVILAALKWPVRTHQHAAGCPRIFPQATGTLTPVVATDRRFSIFPEILSESREPVWNSAGHGGQQTVQTASYAASDCV